MKRLYKSRTDKKIDGVCAGIAEYFEVDPVMVRVVTVLLFVFGGVALLAYIVGMIVIPRKPYELETESTAKKEESVGSQGIPNPAWEESTTPTRETDYSSKGALIIGIVLVLIGFLALADNFHIFRHFYFWSWITHNFWDFLIPGIFIVAGISLLTKSKKEKD